MKTLETNRGNFFVNFNGLLGFFGPEGNLLREATQSEWSWALGVMVEATPEINFDVEALRRLASERAEKVQRHSEECLQKISSFLGIASELVRNFLDELKIQPEDLQISGQMDPNWGTSETSTSGCLYSNTEWCSAWGILSSGEFSKIEKIILDLNGEQNPNGSWSSSYGYSAEYLAGVAPAAIFFIINSGYRYMGSRDTEEDDVWYLYKRPDLSNLLRERREGVVKKVSEFFGNLKNISDPVALFDKIVEELGIKNPEEIIFGEMPDDWAIYSSSEGNDLYSEETRNAVWGFQEELLELEEFQSREHSFLNENDEEENDDLGYGIDEGYSAKYLKDLVPEAKFFVVFQHHKRYAERQPSENKKCWSFLLPPKGK